MLVALFFLSLLLPSFQNDYSTTSNDYRIRDVHRENHDNVYLSCEIDAKDTARYGKRL